MSSTLSGSIGEISPLGRMIRGPRQVPHRNGDIVPWTMPTDGTRLSLNCRDAMATRSWIHGEAGSACRTSRPIRRTRERLVSNNAKLPIADTATANCGVSITSTVCAGSVSSPPAAEYGSAFPEVEFPFANAVTANRSFRTCSDRAKPMRHGNCKKRRTYELNQHQQPQSMAHLWADSQVLRLLRQEDHDGQTAR